VAVGVPEAVVDNKGTIVPVNIGGLPGTVADVIPDDEDV